MISYGISGTKCHKNLFTEANWDSSINEATSSGLDDWKFYLITMSISALEPLSLLSNEYFHGSKAAVISD